MELYLLAFVFLLLFSNLFIVSAQYGWGYGFGFDQVIDSFTQNVEPLLRFVLGGYDWNGYLLFEKLLLTFIITSIAYLSLKNIGPMKEAKPGIVRLIALIVGILGVRNLNDLLLNTIFIQYQVLFVFVGAFIPFLIVWGLLKDLDPWARKIGWVFYVIVYMGLRYTTDVPTHKNVYIWTIVGVIVYAFFLENYALAWIRKQKASQASYDQKLTKIAEINRQIRNLENTPVSRHFTQDDKDRLIAKLIKLREKLGRKMHW